MNSNDTPADRPEPQQASGPQSERRYARRIDCTPSPQRPPPVNPAPRPAAARDDAHP